MQVKQFYGYWTDHQADCPVHVSLICMLTRLLKVQTWEGWTNAFDCYIKSVHCRSFLKGVFHQSLCQNKRVLWNDKEGKEEKAAEAAAEWPSLFGKNWSEKGAVWVNLESWAG